MPTIERSAEEQRQYLRLLVALEANQGQLGLLIAVAENRNLQTAVIEDYEQALREQGVHAFRLFINRQDPSLRTGLEQLVDQQPVLQEHQPAVVTVLGIGDLLPPMLAIPESQQARFLGYLQWTREALRQFRFPVVLWVNRKVVRLLAEQSPDFWSWRSGVFWFGVDPSDAALLTSTASKATEKATTRGLDPDIEALMSLIESLEQRADKDSAQLVDLYAQLGQVYTKRSQSRQNREFAIQVYKRAVQLLEKLDLPAELATSLKQLGNLYFERRYNAREAGICYDEALRLYREVGDRLGEANTLKALGDVLQFLKQSQEALERYDEALRLYREVGDRLGEANTLLGLGSLQDRPAQAMDYYHSAQTIFQQIGDQYCQGRNLLMFIVSAQQQLGDLDGVEESLAQAEAIGKAIDFEPFQQAVDQIRSTL
ncbi:tetratricopeptide repeat protein [Acaryochloris marina]|uniref:TPR domain protein, putative n=1 Tax=Acaryochloris marina (strain MBIC 11017) TaxID=329726 RepID=B0C488_ACAM1|nr:tetratricopeptide repeat protein [Acaryochloris marina]ABW27479.1 TPR domain protein, putative [Acaryochloris marina MBIC11017]